MYPDNQQPYSPAPPPQQNDPYGFIMQNPQKPPRPNLVPGGMKARIIVVAVGVILLIIVGVIISSLLTGGAKAQTERYVEISQKQTEIIRLSALADQKAKSLQTRSFAVTTRVSMTTSQKSINAALAKRGVKEKNLSKVAGLGKNPKSDAELEAAEKTGRFDETFKKIVETEIANYQKLLQAAAGGASPKDKEVLQKAFTGSQILVLKTETKAPTPSTTDETDVLDSEATLFEDSEEDAEL